MINDDNMNKAAKLALDQLPRAGIAPKKNLPKLFSIVQFLNSSNAVTPKSVQGKIATMFINSVPNVIRMIASLVGVIELSTNVPMISFLLSLSSFVVSSDLEFSGVSNTSLAYDITTKLATATNTASSAALIQTPSRMFKLAISCCSLKNVFNSSFQAPDVYGLIVDPIIPVAQPNMIVNNPVRTSNPASTKKGIIIVANGINPYDKLTVDEPTATIIITIGTSVTSLPFLD